MQAESAVDIAYDIEDLIRDGDYASLRPFVAKLIEKHDAETVAFAFEILEEDVDWGSDEALRRFQKLCDEIQDLIFEAL